MQMSSTTEKYYRLASGLKNQKSELVPITENIYKKIQLGTKQDYYLSLFQYNPEHYKEFQKTKSVAGIQDLTTQRLVWDFDSHSDIELARQDAIVLYDRLIEAKVPPEKIRVWFSGNKGFGIDLELSDRLTRQEFVNIVFGLAGDLKTFDTRINDYARVVRLPLTRHHESGLYKVPLYDADIKSLTVEEIKTIAEDISGFNIEDLDPELYRFTLPKRLIELKNTEFKKITQTVERPELTFDVDALDRSSCPDWMPLERFALQEGFFYGSESVVQGERNDAFLILAATYKNQGFSREHALGLLMATAERQAERTGEGCYTEEQINREILNAVYSSSWRGGIFSSDHPLLIKTRQRFNIDEEIIENEVENISNVGEGFVSFAKNISQNRIKLGLSSFDDNIVMTVGQLVTVVAPPGAGKTALSNKFAETVSLENEDVLYFSLDLYKNLLFGRMLQRYISYDIKDIFEKYENGDVDKDLADAYASVLENYSNVNFCFKSCSIDDIEYKIQNTIKSRGKIPRLVIVDYLDKVRSMYTDTTQSSAYVAGRLSDIAKKYNTLVLLLAQPSKMGSSGPEQEFKSYRAIKGSSAIESDSRLILGLSRPGYNPANPETDIYSTISILKNNTGPTMRLDYKWDGLTGSFDELTIDEKRNLKKLRDELEKQRKGVEYDI